MLYHTGMIMWMLGTAGFGVATIGSEFDPTMRWPVRLLCVSVPVTLAGVVLAGIYS